LLWIFNFKTASLDKEFLQLFSELFQSKYTAGEGLQICGMEAGALPLLAHLSYTVPNVKNAFYIRKSRKKADLANLVEGTIRKNLPIVVIDDILMWYLISD